MGWELEKIDRAIEEQLPSLRLGLTRGTKHFRRAWACATRLGMTRGTKHFRRAWLLRHSTLIPKGVALRHSTAAPFTSESVS